MIAITLSGDAAVVARFNDARVKVPQRVTDAVGRETMALTAYVKEQKLSGQVLKNWSGTLRRKINGRVTQEGTTVSGRVGVLLAYAAAHEYGFDGVVNVREYFRRLKSFTREAYTTKSGKQRTRKVHDEGRVRAHSRHMHVPERSFLRSSLRENAPKIQQALAAAVNAGLY